MAFRVPRGIIAPSILASDFTSLRSECEKVLRLGADWLHVDIMDGHFVPNISIGVPVVASLRKALPDAFLDCHCMIEKPEKWLAPFAKAGASQYTFHIEAADDAQRLVDGVHAAGLRAGVAVKPGTSIESVDAVLRSVDMVLVMTVEPGFGGQSFMADMMPKVAALRARYPALDIQVDGGIGPGNIADCVSAGANVIVAGTSIFAARDVGDAITQMRNAFSVTPSPSSPPA